MATPLFSDQALSLVPQQRLRHDVSAFLTDCRARNLAPRTVSIYTRQLDAFASWAGDATAESVSPGDLRGYMLHLQQQGHNAGGQHQAYRVLKTFFRWLVAEGVLTQNPMARLKAPQMREEPLPPVPLPDVTAMLETCASSDMLDLRDAALMLALLDTAARASELLAANVADVDLDAGALVLRVTKNRKQRITFLGARARKALWRYLRARHSEPTEPIFTTREGRRLTYWGLRQVLRRRAAEAGVKEPGAHAFRRAACLAMLRDGADVFSVQALAGHADLSTTRRYLKLAQSDLADAHRKHSPADRLLG